MLEEQIASRDGSVVLAKVDVDANPNLASSHRVQGIPAVKAFKDGRVVSEFVGARSPVAVASFLDELLAPPKVTGLVEELRASGELPDVLEALEADEPERALELVLDAIADATPDDASGCRARARRVRRPRAGRPDHGRLQAQARDRALLTRRRPEAAVHLAVASRYARCAVDARLAGALVARLSSATRAGSICVPSCHSL